MNNSKTLKEPEKQHGETISPINVVYCVDSFESAGNQFIDMLMGSVSSLKEFAGKDDSISVNVLYGNLPPQVIENLHALESDNFKVRTQALYPNFLQELNKYSKPSFDKNVRGWPGIVYARLWLSDILPNLHRVIYLDTDTMVRGSLKELWNTDLKGNVYGMVHGTIPEYGYNSGVILMDLDAIRADNDNYKKLTAFMSQNSAKFYCPDQTTINRFYAGRILELPLKWNYGPMNMRRGDPAMRDAVIWHFYNTKQKPFRIDSDDFGVALLEWNRQLHKFEAELVKSR